MKRIVNVLFSSEMTLTLLLVFATAIGTATFIEEKYDTITARLLVYNAWWFEGVLLLLALNFIGNIKRFNLLRKEKLSSLVFHLAFILLILGAGVTRYVSFEGMMHIREGESSNVIYTPEPYMLVKAKSPEVEYSSDRQMWLIPKGKNTFHDAFTVPGKGEVALELRQYLSNAVTRIDENQEGGKNILQMVIADGNGRETLLMTDGEIKEMEGVAFAYNNSRQAEAIRISEKEGKLFINSSSDIVQTMMHVQGEVPDSTINPPATDTVMEFMPGKLYNTKNTLILFVRLFKNAKQTLVQGGPEDKGTPMVFMDITFNGKKQEVVIAGGKGQPAVFKEVDLDGVSLGLAYGNKEIPLPFSIHLDDFILDRYAGSMSPSSYASEVTLGDARTNLKEKHRIYMNHVLDYQGYRFFQSSYDMDEKGTILSVNHDFWGTWISYTGYILLALGFIVTLFSKSSRFRTLNGVIRKIRGERKAVAITGMTTIMIGISSAVFAQVPPGKPVSAEHAEKFGHLIVQTYDGRFEPMHTLAYDVMHKISRKDKFQTDVKGEMDDIQVFIDMLLDAEYWKQQKVIYVREKSVCDILGVEGKYASFYDFIDQQSMYKLGRYAEEAFRKRPAEQNTFDKEVIRVDERLNVWLSVLNGSLLKVVPLENSPNHQWVSFTDSLGNTNIIRQYFTAVYEATSTGDYSKADTLLTGIGTIQRSGTPAELLPSPARVNLEIWYNTARVFVSLKNWYGVISVVLLILAFVDNLRQRKSKAVTWALNVFIALLGAAFLYHTYGMGLRWYLTGHAPWSNGYEALLLIAWGSLLAGFCFMRYSKITLAATALLAFSILMTASHSSYDPQLTNLQPVLKSYWLIIHVAVITISYGFLALGFILGLINLFIYIFRSARSTPRLDLILKELTCTNEMALLIGIVMATLGTFLGGVWANESWGRYWGWDAKETWALVIVITYAIILHMRFVPAFKHPVVFNAASVLGFGSVVMTFVGVNYYLSKGLHSYAADEKSVFPLWGWGLILCVIALIVAAAVKEYYREKRVTR